MSWTGLKKNLEYTAKNKIMLIDRDFSEISITRQCELIGLNKSTLYYTPALETEFNMKLMKFLDENFTKMPFYGIRKMTVLAVRNGFNANHKRVRRLLRKMGICAIYPKPDLSKSRKEAKKYPYLLTGVEITRPNQVWSTDITYIPMDKGFMYLTVVMDWYSRYVISWELSNSLDVSFCVECLEKALHTGEPEIFNSDQGSQYTSSKFTSILEKRNIKISMDSKGRALDNIFVERLWRSLKYEDVYLKNYRTVKDEKKGIGEYLSFYNEERLHQSLNYKTPKQVHFEKLGG